MHDSLKFVVEIAEECAREVLSRDSIIALTDQLERHKSALEAEYQRKFASDGPPKNIGTSQAWFTEKVLGAVSFAKMAVNPEIRGNYSAEKIVENVRHYAYLVDSRLEGW